MVLDVDVNGFGAAKGKKKPQAKSGKKVLFICLFLYATCLLIVFICLDSIRAICNTLESSLGLSSPSAFSQLCLIGTPTNSMIHYGQMTTTSSKLGDKGKKKRSGAHVNRSGGETMI